MAKGWGAFVRVPIRYADMDVPEAFRLAIEHGLYAYDAYVLAVARMAGAPLVSLDRRQLAAARACGVALVDVTE